MNGRYSNRGIGAVRVRVTHADRDDGNENGNQLNSTIKVGHLNGRYSNRGIGAVRVRVAHADRDDGNENGTAGELHVRLIRQFVNSKFLKKCAKSNTRLQKVEQRVLWKATKQLSVARSGPLVVAVPPRLQRL